MNFLKKISKWITKQHKSIGVSHSRKGVLSDISGNKGVDYTIHK